MFTFVLCSGSRLQRYNLAQAMSSISLYFFLFSQYYSLTLHSQRFATLPLETPYLGSCAIKREWGESPRLSRSCEPPLSTGANERTTEAMHLRAECVGYGWDAIPSYALGRCSRLGGESEDLPKLICRWSHRCAPRGLGAYDRNTYII